MFDFWSNRLIHILLLSTFVVVGQACSEEEEEDKPKKSKSVSAPTSSVSSGTTAAPVPQSVQPLEDIPPTLTWDETHSNLEVVVGVTATYTFTALSDQASPVSYEISTVESTCISITWFDEISIDTVSGELRAKAAADASGTCKLFINAKSFPSSLTQEVDITVQPVFGFGSTPSSFTSDEDSPLSGIAIQAVSTLASPSYGWLLKAESSNCDEFSFSVPFAVDPATGEVSGTPSLDGTCSFTVEITDGTHVAEKLFTLNISSVNDPVVYDSGASTLTIENGTSFSETIRYTDEDDTPTYALDLAAMTCDEEKLIVSLNIDSASGVLSGTPDFLGTCTISVSVASGVETVAHAISFTSQDTVAPNSPSAFALGSGISSPTTNQQPSFDVTVTAVEGSIKLYSGAGCTNYLEAFEVSGLNESITVSSPLSEGDYNFSVSHADPSGNESVCFGTAVPSLSILHQTLHLLLALEAVLAHRQPTSNLVLT